MSYFMPEPSLTLPDAESLLDAIRNPDWMKLPHPGKWNVRSDWLVSLLNEMQPSPGGTVYNSEAQSEAEMRLGIESRPDNGDPLATLIYNAQKFRRSDQLIADGYEPLTAEMIERAGVGGKIALLGCEPFNVRETHGAIRLMKPRARNFQVLAQGQPARIVSYGKRTATV